LTLFGVKAVNPIPYDFDLTIKVYDFAQDFLEGRNRFGVGLPFLVLVVTVKGMGHKAVKEIIKLRYDFLGNGFPALSCVIRVVLHE
jgi:hypothetical protein